MSYVQTSNHYNRFEKTIQVSIVIISKVEQKYSKEYEVSAKITNKYLANTLVEASNIEG